MWNDLDTSVYDGMISETVRIPRADGGDMQVYWSRPTGDGPFPGIVLIPHMPGWDEYMREAARRFTQHGYSVICPNIYEKFGHGKPADVANAARAQGGAKDEDVMKDTSDSLAFLKNRPDVNGKVGVIGMCSGGRHTYLAACTIKGFDAAVDCWGGATSSPGPSGGGKQPIDYTEDLSCPLLGIFGNEDHWPEPSVVDEMEAKLKECGKDYVFYRYDGAGHGIWYYDKPMYRQEQAMDSFNKVLEFFDTHLKG